MRLSIESLSPLEKSIMDIAVDDVMGLYEVSGLVRAKFSAENPGAIARRAVVELLRAGWIELINWNPYSMRRDKIPTDGIDSLLNDPESWSIPRAPARPALWATSAALEAFHGINP